MSEHNTSNQKMHDTLERTVRHVVETMCFAEVAPTEETWKNADTIVTAVNFYGSRSGRLQLEVSSSAAWSLRDAFLGQSESDPDNGTAREIVGELGTMICGRFLSAVDPLSKMTLATPQISNENVHVNQTKDLRQGFLLDAGHLTASVEFDTQN